MNRKIMLALSVLACLAVAGCSGKTAASQPAAAASSASPAAAGSTVSSSPALPSSSAKPASSSSAAGKAIPSFASSGSAGTASADVSQLPSSLKTALSKYVAKKVVSLQNLKTDSGQDAVFALDSDGTVWFVTSSGAKKLKTGVASPQGRAASTALWTVDGVKIFKCESGSGGSSSISLAWYVKNGKPVELPYTGMSLTYNGNGRFTTIGDAFDAVFSKGVGTGHTYRVHYLYWAKNGLKEYGGLKISREQLQKIKGAPEILDAITKSGYTVDTILYRANNVININYHSGNRRDGKYDNVTLLYQNGSVTPAAAYGSGSSEKFSGSTLDDFSYGGTYQKALFPKIAVYPDKFPVG